MEPETQSDGSPLLWQIGGIDLPLERPLLVAVDFRKAQQLVAESAHRNDMTAEVGKVPSGSLTMVPEVGSSEDESVRYALRLAGLWSPLRAIRAITASSPDEVTDGTFDWFALGIRKFEEDVDQVACGRNVNPAGLFLIDGTSHGGIAIVCAEQEQCGVNVGGPCLDGNDRLMHLSADVAGNQFEGTFREADRGVDIKAAFTGVDRQSGKLQFGN